MASRILFFITEPQARILYILADAKQRRLDNTRHRDVADGLAKRGLAKTIDRASHYRRTHQLTALGKHAVALLAALPPDAR